MFFVRKMVLICLKYNILIRNHLADSLSHLQIRKCLQMAQPPWINRQQTYPITCSHRIGKVLLLVKSSPQPSSIPTYKRAWKLFYQFLFNTLPGTSVDLPISPPTLALFIAYLFVRHYASSTINTYVSAIGYSHKLAGLPDPTKTFFINQMLKGYGKIGFRRAAGSRLLCQFSIGLLGPHLNLWLLFSTHVDFRPCACLPFTHLPGWGKSLPQLRAPPSIYTKFQN